MKGSIITFSKNNYSNLEKRVVEAHDLVLLCQRATLSNPTVAYAASELEAQREWMILANAEKGFLLQRSTVSWISEGDSNTAYFFRMAATRRSINNISFLFDDADVKIDSQEGI